MASAPTALRAAPDEAARTTGLPWRLIAIVALLAAYVALTALVLTPDSVLIHFDYWLKKRKLINHYPQYHDPVYYYVMLGQRGPATLTFLPFFLWVAWRQRTTRPLVMLGAALLWLNFSVGIVKYGLGRVGPMHSDAVHKFFDWGNSIYPSGHVANTVVLYGLIAWIAPKHRTALTRIAIFLSFTIGLGTIYLRTHWFSDVVGGWIAGGLVLVTLPYLMPTAQRWTDRLVAAVRARWAARWAERWARWRAARWAPRWARRQERRRPAGEASGPPRRVEASPYAPRPVRPEPRPLGSVPRGQHRDRAGETGVAAGATRRPR